MAEKEKLEAKAEKKVEKKAKEKKPSVFKRFAAWLRSVKAELKKIVWASPKSVRSNTIMVLIVLIVFAVVVGALDFVFSRFFTELGKLI